MTLIKKAKSDPKAFVELYDLYVERVYRYFLRRLQNETEAEDLTSQLWEKVLNKLHTLKSDLEESFVAWLFAIARNELNQHFKIQKKNKIEALKDSFVDVKKRPDEVTALHSQADLVREVVNRLPDQQKETVELRYFADLRNKEIALTLDISEKTVASNLSRALKTLQNYLEKLQ